MKSKLYFLLFFVFVSCKIIEGNSSLNECVSAEECYQQYYGCPLSEEYVSQTSTNLVSNILTDYVYAQSLTFPVDKKISSFILRLSKGNSPVGNLSLEIREDCSGNPCENYLAQSEIIRMEDLPTSNSEVTFAFSEYETLTANTTYWVVLPIYLNGQSPAIIRFSFTNSNPYSGGVLNYKPNNGSWVSSATYDFYFRLNTCL